MMVWKVIANFIDKKGIKQSTLAQKTGLSQQAICNLLKGNRNIEIEEYIKICDVLEVSYDYFIELSKAA